MVNYVVCNVCLQLIGVDGDLMSPKIANHLQFSKVDKLH